jgi:diguanylate cyclase (GGDEF)-like protein/PAS domain S-box-containing protein
VADGATVISGPERVDRAEEATVVIAGRAWTVTYSAPVPGMLAPLVILLAGSVLAGAVALAFWRSASAQRRLSRSEERFRAMADASPALILTFDEDGACTYVNREWRWTTGREPAEDMGDGWLGAVEEGDVGRFREHFAEARRTRSRVDHELHVRRADGSVCTMLARIAPTREGEAGEVAWVGTLLDLTARRAAESARQSAAVERALAREQEALKRIATAIAREDPTDRVFSLVVEEALQTLGARAVRLLHPGGEGRPAEVVAAVGHLRGPVTLGEERAGAGSDAIAVEVEASGREWGWLVAFGSEAHDARPRLEHLSELVSLAITSAETRRRLAQSAVTDPLTGLANRRAFDERLAAEIARARRHGRPLALVMVDIDEFKRVNDTHGHQAGDRVLRAVADALAATTREGEIVARVGGEEFAWLLPDAAVGDAFRAAERARAGVAATTVEPVGAVTVSAGVADLLAAGGAEDLVARADRALYAAKSSGRDRTVADVGEPADRAGGEPVDLELHPSAR